MNNRVEQVTEIFLEDVTFINESLADDVGRVFIWQGRLFRGVRQEYVADVEALLSCGLLQELIAKGLLPEVQKTNYVLDGFNLVLEHERIPVVTYPYEWSFSMLKDAAITMLRVNQIAGKYGYQTKDAHGYNILFRGSQPVFIDLGSFIKVQAGDDGWVGYEEFLRFFYYPLQMWSAGNEFLAQRVFSGAMQPLMPHESFLAYRIPLTRHLNEFKRRRLSRLPLLLERVSNMPKENIKQSWPGKKGALLYWFRPLFGLFTRRSDLTTLRRNVQNMEFDGQESMWGAYHLQSGLLNKSGTLHPSPRFKRLAELIDKFGIKTVVELAGNQGAFARYLTESTQVQSVICTDYDANAVDSLYCELGPDQAAVTPAVLNFMSPVLLSETQIAPQRMQAEGVVALAVVHHLLLTQRLSIDRILLNICQYASKYVFVEFMPLGLYDGHVKPNVPPWYKLEWFRNACAQYFQIVVEEKLEENRILIVGRLGD